VVRVGNDEREIVVGGRDLGRLSFTNVRDGVQPVRVALGRDFQPLSVLDTEVPIACEQPGPGSVSANEVDVLVACRGERVAVVRMANPTPEPRIYVIAAGAGDASTRSSTTAAPFGVAFRNVTLATSAPATVTVSSPGLGEIYREVVDLRCDGAQTTTANNTLVLDANSRRVHVAHDADGLPIIAYERIVTEPGFQLSFGSEYPSDLQLIRCADASCRAMRGESTAVLNGGFEDVCCTREVYRPFGLDVSPAGNPIILYEYTRGSFGPDGAFEERYEGLVICHDPACANGNETVTRSLFSETGYRLDSILAVGADGSPLLLATATSPNRERVIVGCQDPLCGEVTVEPVVIGGQHDGSADNPSWWTDGVLHTCNDPDCTAGAVTTVAPPLPDGEEFTERSDLWLSAVALDPEGRPAWLYRGRRGFAFDRRLKLLRCSDQLCDPAGVTTVSIAEPGDNSDTFASRSLQIGLDGRPAIFGTLWVTTCRDIGCTQQATRLLDTDLGEYPSRRLFGGVYPDPGGAPLILTSQSDGQSYWSIETTKCVDFDCGNGSSTIEPSAEIDVVASCFQDSGRADAYLRNLTDRRISVSIIVEGVAEKRRDLYPGEIQRVTLTGLDDGRAVVTARGSTPLVDDAFESIFARKEVSFGCADGGLGIVPLDPADSSEAQWRAASGCVAGAGVIELYRMSVEGGSVVAESAELGNRSTTATPFGLARIRYGAVADGTYPLAIRGQGLVAEVQIACAATLVESCLADRGRVDIFVRNATNAPQTLEVLFGTLAPRTAVVPAGDLHRFVITGRPNGEHTVAVSSLDGAGNSKSLLSDVVTIDCGPNAMARPALDFADLGWRALTGCRNGAGVIELVAVSPTQGVFALNTPGLSPLRTQVRDAGLIRFAAEDVPNGTYELTPRGDTPVAIVTVDCGV